jgi:hypothetical protein
MTKLAAYGEVPPWARFQTHELGAAALFFLSNGDGFAASQVLHLETLMPPSKLGAIVAVSSRHLRLC